MPSAPNEIARRPGRSHPPSLLRLAERLIRDERLIERGDVVLCACSGGPDSTALLHVLARLRARVGFSLVAHGVDHGLRPEAAGEIEHAERTAAAHGVPFGVTHLTVTAGGNLQARARDARRAALREAARLAGARLVATGHTADDRAETFLLRLLRGAGPHGLAVMPPSAPLEGPEPALQLIRPLLVARRADVLAHLARHELSFAADPSNADARFLRVRVRAELLPLLESMSPGITEHLCSLADMLAAELPPEGALRGLGRAQRLAVARAKKCERAVNLRLPGGREVTVGFSAGEPVLIEKPRPRGP
jgi:tRNA(Ile)-lysidine synthase